ncbi:MAG: hypothetical protein CME06_18000 [Gemmatimonadetes bacterium]|nr:hypothetical protein [Gemmatimonadota bacterium]
MRTLYLSYTGILEPLAASQIVPHLIALTRRGWPIDAVSWEKPERLARRDLVESLDGRFRDAGIEWTPLRYHKRPTAPATIFDLAAGLRHLSRHPNLDRWEQVHVRSYVPAPLALALRRRRSLRFLFDMRGFWADEYVDGEIWPPASPLYRFAKKGEAAFLRAADDIVVLSHEAKRILEQGHPRLPLVWRSTTPPIHVIPTCADLERFHPDGELHPAGRPIREDRFVIGYVGSIGTWYEFEAMLDLVASAHVRDSRVHFLVVTQTPGSEVRRLARSRNLPDVALTVAASEPADVPSWIRCFDLGLFFITPAFSKRASCATKMGEILGCGVPLLINRGVGDSEALVDKHRVGIAAHDLRPWTTSAAYDRVRTIIDGDPELKRRCRRTAEAEFDLARAIEAYVEIYRSAAAGGAA